MRTTWRLLTHPLLSHTRVGVFHIAHASLLPHTALSLLFIPGHATLRPLPTLLPCTFCIKQLNIYHLEVFNAIGTDGSNRGTASQSRFETMKLSAMVQNRIGTGFPMLSTNEI